MVTVSVLKKSGELGRALPVPPITARHADCVIEYVRQRTN